MIKGLDTAFKSSGISFAFWPLIPPIALTPFLRKILAVTLKKTLVNKSWKKLMNKIISQVLPLSHPIALSEESGSDKKQN